MNGNVLLYVEGLMPERLLNRALSEGARFRSVRRTGRHTMLVRTDPAGAAILQRLCEKFSIPCDIVDRRGHDAAAHRLKQRATLLAGAVVCFVCMAAFLSRVWIIDIQSADSRTLDPLPLRQQLDALEIRPGIAKAVVDPSLLETELAASGSEYSFVGVRIQGIRLLVEAAPVVPAPELYTVSGGRDLVASCDGVALSVNVQSGTASVAPGDTILRGQTLIRGEERATKEETRSIEALGEVVARTWCSGEASAPLEYTGSTRTGRSSISSEIRLLSFAWPLTEGESYSSQEEQTEILPIGGLFLPLEIRRTTAMETTEHTMKADEDALHRALAALAFAEANTERAAVCPDGKVADSWLEYTRDGRNLHARAVLELHCDVAVTRDSLYQQGG